MECGFKKRTSEFRRTSLLRKVKLKVDISLENETQHIYRKEIEALIQRDEKYRTLGPAELEAIVRAFELTLTNGREKVRAQMLYDLIHQKRDD